MKNKKVLILITLAMLVLIVNLVNGQACTPAIQSACGVSISTIGHGAVQLCNNCFVCGIADGVCPSLYSEGSTSSGPELIYMKSGTADRPTTDQEYSVAFTTGNLACQSIGATFAMMQTRTTSIDSWTDDISILGTTDVSSLAGYFQARCETIQITPNCDACPDPDCKTEIRGMAYTQNTNTIIKDASMTIIPENHPDDTYVLTNTSNSSGHIELQGYTGNVTVICSADYYEPNIRTIKLQPGKNIIDCKMTNAVCASDCTLPGVNYNRICSEQCRGINGCEVDHVDPSFSSYGDTLTLCDYLNKNTFFVVDREIINTYLNLTGVDCCARVAVANPIESKLVPIFNPQGTNIRNLITRTYNKDLNGEPVSIKIVVYNKK